MRPDRIESIEVVWNRFFPFPFISHFSTFGKMFVRNGRKGEWEFYEKTGKSEIMLNHSMIHVKQAVAAGNSWFRFYMLYILEWIKANPLINGFGFAFHMNPFEMEAYGHEGDMTYTVINHYGAEQWKIFRKMEISERMRFWRMFRSKEHISFGSFVNRYIIGMEENESLYKINQFD